MPLKETLTNDIKWLTNERKKLLLSETNLKSKLTTANTNLTNQEKILQEKDNLINNLEEQIKLLTPLKVDISTQTGEWEEGEKLGLTSEDISLMEKKIKTLSHKLILGNIHKNASDYMRRDLTLKVKNLDQLLIETAKERKWLVKNNQEFQEKIQELETILNKKEGDTYQAQVKIRELEELLTEKNEDLSKLPKITQAEFTEVENQLTKFKQKAKDQELEIRGLKAETMSLKQKELAAQNKISDLNLIKSSLESKLSENQILLDSLGKEGIGSQKTIQEQQTKIKLISEDLENIKKQLKIATKERDNYKKESGEKEKELNEITVQLKEKEQELNNLKVKGIGELEGQVKFLEEKSKQEQREKEKLERHAKELREQISDCKIRMDSLVEQAKVQQLIEEINNREVEKQRIKKELEELTKLSKSEKVELENKIISLQNDYQKLKEGENKKITQLEKNVLIKIKKTIEGLTGIEKGTEEESKKNEKCLGKTLRNWTQFEKKMKLLISKMFFLKLRLSVFLTDLSS